VILFVDDEIGYTSAYKEELELSGYIVRHERSVDHAVEILERGQEEINLLILDIMMPPGRKFKDEETMDGLRTGEKFYEWVRDRYHELPVIILTNVSDENFSLRFDYDIQCMFTRKIDINPDQLLNCVRTFLQPND
jgi:CheY-like chemotaxis protein